MKKLISLLLAILVTFVGCAAPADSDIAVTYEEARGEPGIYYTLPELLDAATCVFEGTVTDISFWVNDYGSVTYLFTIYEVETTNTYKGDVGTTEYVAMQFGIKDYKVEEQIQVQRDAGMQNPTRLRVTRFTTLEIGSQYLFLADDDYYEHYIMGVAPLQFAITDDPELNFHAPYFSPEEIIAYIQENQE